MMRQLPTQYAIFRQTISGQLESLAQIERTNPKDVNILKKIDVGLGELKRRLLKFNRDENLEEMQGVKKLLQVKSEKVNSFRQGNAETKYNGKSKQNDSCNKCGK